MLELLTELVLLFVGPVLVIWWIPYLVHEIGHAVAAAVVGAGFDYVPLGPFIATKSSSGWRVRRHVLRLSCDAVIPSPGSPRRQMFVATVGGPVANLAVGLAAVAIGFGGAAERAHFLAPLALLLLGVFTTMNGVAQLLPWRPHGIPTDGRRAISLLLGSRAGHRWVALKLITAASHMGVRPRDWEPHPLQALVAPSDGSLDDVAGALSLYWHLLDDHRLDEARMCLEQARAAASQRHLTQLNSQLVLLELAYVEARFGTDPSIAVEHFARSASIARATFARVLAAIALSYSDLDGAEHLAAAARRELGDLRPGFALMEEDLLLEIEAEARRRREAVAVPPSRQALGPSVDVSRFAVPDVELRPPPVPPGARSFLTMAGVISAVLLGATLNSGIGAFSREAGAITAIATTAISVGAVLRVRTSRGERRVDLLREMFALMATIAIASPLLISDLFRANSAGWIWIAGEIRPCLEFGTGHDIAAANSLFASAFALVGLLIATRARSGPALPRRGVVIGFLLIALWLVTVGADHKPFAAMIGCAG